jgi:hypothetical protein
MVDRLVYMVLTLQLSDTSDTVETGTSMVTLS